MDWGLGLQQSRLARRLLGVFLACIVLPVVVLGTVSYLQVRNQLVDQSHARLEQDARAVVMSVLERLVLADGVMRTLSTNDIDIRLADRRDDAVQPIAAAIWTDGRGKSLASYGEWARVPVPTPQETDRLQQGSVLRFHPENGRVILAREVTEGQLWVAVDTTFLWSSAAEFADLRGAGTSCIVDSAGLPIRCDAALAGIDLAPKLRTRAPFSLENPSTEFRAVTREIYFDWYFGAEPWSVVLAEPVEEAVASLQGFRQIFLPVALLSIFGVMFFSSLQLRRIFARLLRLKSATSRMAMGDFGGTIAMEGNDEITELAGSFDIMATQLGQQFALIRATGAVDRAALETDSIGELCSRIVLALGESFPKSPRLVFLGLDDGLHGGLRGALAHSLHPAPQDDESPHHADHADLSLTQAQAGRIGRLVWSGLHSATEVEGILGVTGLFAETGTPQLALFPIRLDGEVHGFVAVGGNATTDENRPRCRQLADQIAVALSNVKRLDELQRLNWGALTALARAVDAASEWTAGHSERVAGLSEQLGARLGLPPKELERLRRGGLLHDIGKLGVPADILEKNGKLSRDEYLKVQEHTVIGAKILEPIESFADIIPLVLYHHERIDGAGYPMRVSGTAIPYGARIMAVADTYDALTSDRPYRKGMERDRALGILEDEAGRQLDGAMVAEFVDMIRTEGETHLVTAEVPFERRNERGTKRERKNSRQPERVG